MRHTALSKKNGDKERVKGKVLRHPPPPARCGPIKARGSHELLAYVAIHDQLSLFTPGPDPSPKLPIKGTHLLKP